MAEGMKTVTKRLASGVVKTYAYDRKSRQRVVGAVGSTEFVENLQRIRMAQGVAPIVLAPLPAVDDWWTRGRMVFVYFIQAASGPIKIGITDNVKRRLEQIRISLYEEIAVLAVFYANRNLERRLHRLFAPHRIRNDWFQPHHHIFREIECLKNEAVSTPRKLPRDNQPKTTLTD